MMSPLEHFPVNWIDGMKISRKHFEQDQDHVIDIARDIWSGGAAPFNFGLLPGDNSLKINVHCDFNQQINISVDSCNATTANGSRISVMPSFGIKKTTNLKEIAEPYSLQLSHPQVLMILLSVNPFDRVPFGEPAIDENPPRHPFSHAKINLDVVPEEQAATSYFENILVVGKIRCENGELSYEEDYIPPCSTTNSFAGMREKYESFQNLLFSSRNSLESCCYRIIEKIRNQDKNVQAIGIAKLVEKMVYEIATIKANYKWILPFVSPVYLAESLTKILYSVNTTMQWLAPEQRTAKFDYKAVLFDYFRIIGFTQLREQFDVALQAEYDHYNLHKLFRVLQNVFGTIQQLFEHLLKLEIIGEPEGDVLFDRKVQPPTKQTLKHDDSSVLGD